MGETFPFQNCSGFTDEQFTAIALARGITAAVGSAILFLVFVGQAVMICAKRYYQRVCGTAVKRLIIWLTAINVVYELFLALNLKHYFHPEMGGFCIADGFFDQYFASVQLYLTFGICLILFLKVLTVTTSWEVYSSKAKDKKLEIGLIVSIFVIPLLYNLIPFFTNSYGPFGSWCWIVIFKSDCSKQDGWWEQIVLWDVPFGIVALLTIVLFIASLCLLCYGTKHAQLKKMLVAAISNSIVSLTLMFVLRILQTIAYFFYPASTFGHATAFSLRVLYAVAAPLTGTLIPLALLVAIYLPFSLIIVRRTQSTLPDPTRQTKTLRFSTIMNLPSHTTWDSPHSTSEDSEHAPISSSSQPKYGTADS